MASIAQDLFSQQSATYHFPNDLILEINIHRFLIIVKDLKGCLALELKLLIQGSFVLKVLIDVAKPYDCFVPLRRQSVKFADGTNGPNMTLYQRLLYGSLISELICQINHTICFCFSVTKPKINHRIRIPKYKAQERIMETMLVT